MLAGAVDRRGRLFYGSCAWEGFGPAGFPSVPVRQPAYSCHPFVWRRMRGGSINTRS